MSHSVEAETEKLDFKWNKKRGVGGKKKEIQFYESFTYDGIDYALYDCVYLYKEGEPEPYIGKLIKIWELPDKTKKVKILWFFRPLEVSNWLGEERTLENELFLASGEGVGLANVNPLEVLAGKCCVVCTSTDSRNPQPSEEELRMADYVFYRTFDVGSCTISNKIDDKIAGIEVKFIFNKKDRQSPGSVLQLDSDKKEDMGNALESKEKKLLSKQHSYKECQTVKVDGSFNDRLVKEEADVKPLFIARDFSSGEKPGSGAGAESHEIIATNVEEEHASGGETTFRPKVDLDKIERKVKEERVSGDKTAPKSKVDFDKTEGKVSKVLVNQDAVKEKVKFTKDSAALDNRPLKKAKLDTSVELPQENRRNDVHVQKLNIDSDGNDVKASSHVDTLSEDKTKSKGAGDSPATGNGPSSKKLKSDEIITKVSNGNSFKARSSQSPDEGRKSDGQLLEVTRRPNADRSKWFKGLPWEERMQTAYRQGTLVLLQNLDPAYTSAEVEDIVWHGFELLCTAKMIQRTAISSPHSGQAFVIFKTKEAAEMVVRKLDEGCLVLSNGRPLVGSVGTPNSLEKQLSFIGHLSVDKVKLLTQRGEMRQAVSTSHCSQPNTVEYEMAMEWCLLQERSDRWWKKLYKYQGEELRKLKADLKSK
ncbi:protein ANTI-SILENCING 1 [Malania oleifera]|uniref:protein ANTI-SILENCING 1 n=1 Tax=Malania oleifera TaxID=397392 RepID=UPI0025AE480C|nr:protein ANTI-SILENCING 1 [Malania oleifera]